MADYLKIVYPGRSSAPQARADLDNQALREAGDLALGLVVRLKLAPVPAGDLSRLSREAAPQRFERAVLAEELLKEQPERGEPGFFQEAAERDAGLGELVVMVDPFAEWVEQQLALELAELTGLTGRVEAAVDRLRLDPTQLSVTAPFKVGDLERQREDDSAAARRGRADSKLAKAAEQEQASALSTERDVAARRLRGVDPERLLEKPAPKLKKGKD